MEVERAARREIAAASSSPQMPSSSSSSSSLLSSPRNTRFAARVAVDGISTPRSWTASQRGQTERENVGEIEEEVEPITDGPLVGAASSIIGPPQPRQPSEVRR